MTRLGKILVLSNLALSLVFAVWALAFHTQRIDWTASRAVPTENTVRAPNPSFEQVNNIENKDTGVASVQKDPTDSTVVLIKGLKPGSTHVVLTDPKGKKQGFDVYVDEGLPGKLAERIDEIHELQGLRDKAETAYDAALQDLVGLERQRPEQLKWYADQLRLLERGDKPVNAVVYVKGEPQIDSQERPVMARATTSALKEILPREAYQAQLDQLAKQIENYRTEIKGQLQQQADLADRLKDLRARLAAEQESLRKFGEEREYLQPRLYNREVEARTLRDRREELEKRLQELKRAGVTAP